jgi:hypothetical protein
MTDVMRMDVLMDFDVLAAARGSICRAAVRFQRCAPSIGLDEDQTRTALVALHYGQVLGIHGYDNARAELFARVATFAHQLTDTSDDEPEFGPWKLHAGDADFPIWPWAIADVSSGWKPKTYTATLKQDPNASLWMHLKMAAGQERILTPASAMLAIWTLARDLDAPGRRRLGEVLLAMNHHYGTAEQAAFVGPLFLPDRRNAAVEAALPHLSPQLARIRASYTVQPDTAEQRAARRAAATERGRRRGYRLAFWGVSLGMAGVAGAALAGVSLLLALPGGPLAWGVLGSLVAFVWLYRRLGLDSLDRYDYPETEAGS